MLRQDPVYLMPHPRAFRRRRANTGADTHELQSNDADLAIFSVLMVMPTRLRGHGSEEVDICKDTDADSVDEEDWWTGLRGVWTVPVRYLRTAARFAGE